MAILRLLDEFCADSNLVELSPGKKCLAHCTYCFAELNRRVQVQGQSRNYEDPGTFESLIERSYGPSYEPTNVLQYNIRNRYPVCWSNTVEPFQDIEQARAIINILDHFDIPSLIQTKGVNCDAVWDDVKKLAGNAIFYVSFPTDNDAVIKRFEAGTPKSKYRYELIRRAAEAGFHVVLGLTPWHEHWCDDHVAHLERCIEMGIKGIFFDRLHLNDRQIKAIREQNLDLKLLDLLKPDNDAIYPAYDAIMLRCLTAGINVTTNEGRYLGLGYAGIDSPLFTTEIITRGKVWPYGEKRLYRELEVIQNDMPEDKVQPIVVTFNEVMNLFKDEPGATTQSFTLSSMKGFNSVKNLAPSWHDALFPAAPMSEYIRALWNDPCQGNQALWKHARAKIAVRTDGTPWRDENGNLVMLFGSGLESNKRRETVVGNLDDLPWLVASTEEDDILTKE